jgi:hypothetical protein
MSLLLVQIAFLLADQSSNSDGRLEVLLRMLVGMPHGPQHGRPEQRQLSNFEGDRLLHCTAIQPDVYGIAEKQRP